MRDVYLRAETLSVGYNGESLISEINLELKKSQIITIIGPNASGKSTILKTFTRHLPAICGNVYLSGMKISELSGKDLAQRLSVVLTERIRPELMICWDIVATGRYPYTSYFGQLTPKDREIVRESMDIVGAMHLSERSFETLSDGQRQRIMLARAICQQPELMILDEPTSFLDIRYKLELIGILRKMAREKGITVVMSLHELDLAQKASDYVICVKGDKLFAHGSPEEIFNSGLICSLYGLEAERESFPLGNIELPKPTSQPRVFVLAGAGSGAQYFRFLSRKGISFYTGVLQKNDIDYYLAKPVSKRIFAAEAFEDFSDAVLEEAQTALLGCRYLIDCGCEIKQHNGKNKLLIEAAQNQGIEILRGMARVKAVLDD